MKKSLKWFGIIAIVALIAFSTASCFFIPFDEDDDDDDDDYSGGGTASSLNGTWQQDTDLWIVEIQGTYGIITGWGNGLHYYEQDAVNKGYITTGGQHIRNLEKTDSLTWIGQGLIITGTTVNAPATGTTWTNITIKLNESGNYFDVYNRSSNSFIATYRRK
jgi:hypothetical protein